MKSVLCIHAALVVCLQWSASGGPVKGALLEAPVSLGQSPETVDVRQYGAIGNGEADDTEALAKAFSDACAAGKHSVYVSPGTYIFNPAVAQMEICSNERVYGAGTIRIKPGSGDYGYIFVPKPTVKEVSDFTMEGITIDQNAQKNTSASVSNKSGHSQIVFATYIGRNLAFRHLTVYASGVNTIVANGPSVRGVTVEKCHFVFQKSSSAEPFDNSTIYINGGDFSIRDNRFESDKNGGAVTAIELHEGGGIVSGNDMSWYYTGGILTDTKAATVTLNSVKNAGAGFLLWALDGKTTDRNTFSNNTIELNQATRGAKATSGIATYYIGKGVSGDHSNVTITKNVIRFEPEAAGRSVAAYVNYGIGLQCLGNVKGALIEGNTITNAPVRGIKIGVAASHVATEDVVVTGNTITDSGGNPDPASSEYAAAIVLEGNLTNVEVRGNEISFTARRNSSKHSLYSNEKTYQFKNVFVYGNAIRSASRVPPDGLTEGVRRTAPER